jgi:hypothetical protein
MALKIVKAAEPMLVERINVCLYSSPGCGKTTMGFTANKPLLLDADEGSYRAGNRKDTVVVKQWSDMASISKEDLEPYSTIVVDTAGRALDKLTASIIEGNPKMGRGGALTLQGYGELKSKFGSWLKMLNTLGKDVVLLCHMDEQRKGDDVIERLDVQGGSKGEIYKSVDAMGKLYIEGKKRMLDFSPRENAYGKNPAQFEILEVPSPLPTDFLAGLITQIKTKLNHLAEVHKDETFAQDTWAEIVAGLTTPADFNALVGEAKKAGAAVSAVLHKAALKRGLTYNKSILAYEVKEAALVGSKS